MEVRLSPERQAKLSRMAAGQGRSAEALVEDAVDRLLSYEEWFSDEADKDLVAADNGEFVEDADVLRMIELARDPQ